MINKFLMRVNKYMNEINELKVLSIYYYLVLSNVSIWTDRSFLAYIIFLSVYRFNIFLNYEAYRFYFFLMVSLGLLCTNIIKLLNNVNNIKFTSSEYSDINMIVRFVQLAECFIKSVAAVISSFYKSNVEQIW